MLVNVGDLELGLDSHISTGEPNDDIQVEEPIEDIQQNEDEDPTQ